MFGFNFNCTQSSCPTAGYAIPGSADPAFQQSDIETWQKYSENTTAFLLLPYSGVCYSFSDVVREEVKVQAGQVQTDSPEFRAQP